MKLIGKGVDIVRSEYSACGAREVNWDGADDSLAPEYETAATTLKSKGDIKLAKVSPLVSLLPPFIYFPTSLSSRGNIPIGRDADE